MLKDILNWLFQVYEKENIRYCILRNYEKLPDINIGNDIDILIDERCIKKNFKIMQEMCKRFNLCCIRLAKRQYVHQWYFVSKKNPNFPVLQLDFQFAGEWRGFTYLPGNNVLGKREKFKNFYIPCEKHEIVILLFASLIWGGYVKDKYSCKIELFVKAKPNKYLEVFKYCLNTKLAKEIVNLIELGQINDCINLIKSLRLHLAFKSFVNVGVINTLRRIILFYLYELKVRIKPPGLFMVVIGPDGVGKSTIINKIVNRVEKYFKRDYILLSHSRPRLLKDPGKYMNKKSYMNSIINYPHSKKPNGIMISLIRLVYYTVDYTVGFWVKFSRSLRKSGLVIVDRYYYDFFVDPQRYRMKLPMFIFRIFYLFIPKPDLSIYLDANPKIIFSRKSELSLLEIDRQIKLFNDLKKIENTIFCVDANNDIEKLTEDIENLILQKITVEI